MDLWQKLKSEGKPVLLYGTGNGADKVMDELEKRGIPVCGIFASTEFVRDRYFRGFRVESYDGCRRKFPDAKILMCFGSSRPEVLDNVRRMMAESDLFIPEVPVYGDEIFDADYYEKNRDSLEKVRRILADEKSVFTFDSIINYRLTGKPEYLFACETTKTEADGLIRLPGSTVIADLGAYNGDTVLKYSRLYPDYARIVAVEPDRKNYEKLCRNTADVRNVTAVNALIADCDRECTIEGAKGRGVHEASEGKTVRGVSIDNLFENEKVGFIKFDVEGNELEAIRGGIRTIKKHRPAMLVSCYHRSGDLFTLPLAVLSVVPDYRVYLRHLPGVPAWDTQFYFI